MVGFLPILGLARGEEATAPLRCQELESVRRVKTETKTTSKVVFQLGIQEKPASDFQEFSRSTLRSNALDAFGRRLVDADTKVRAIQNARIEGAFDSCTVTLGPYNRKHEGGGMGWSTHGSSGGYSNAVYFVDYELNCVKTESIDRILTDEQYRLEVCDAADACIFRAASETGRSVEELDDFIAKVKTVVAQYHCAP